MKNLLKLDSRFLVLFILMNLLAICYWCNCSSDDQLSIWYSIFANYLFALAVALVGYSIWYWRQRKLQLFFGIDKQDKICFVVPQLDAINILSPTEADKKNCKNVLISDKKYPGEYTGVAVPSAEWQHLGQLIHEFELHPIPIFNNVNSDFTTILKAAGRRFKKPKLKLAAPFQIVPDDKDGTVICAGGPVWNGITREFLASKKATFDFNAKNRDKNLGGTFPIARNSDGKGIDQDGRDLAILEKYTDSSGKVRFLAVGKGRHGSYLAVEKLVDDWPNLWKKYGWSDFTLVCQNARYSIEDDLSKHDFRDFEWEELEKLNL